MIAIKLIEKLRYIMVIRGITVFCVYVFFNQVYFTKMYIYDLSSWPYVILVNGVNV